MSFFYFYFFSLLLESCKKCHICIMKDHDLDEMRDDMPVYETWSIPVLNCDCLN